MTPSWQSCDCDTIYRPDRKWGPDFVSEVLYALLTSTLSDMFGWHKIWIMTSWWWTCDLSTIFRPDRKWGLDFVSQGLYGVLTTNLVWYVTMTKESHPWHGGHVTWIQFTDKIKNKDQIWYLKF